MDQLAELGFTEWETWGEAAPGVPFYLCGQSGDLRVDVGLLDREGTANWMRVHRLAFTVGGEPAPAGYQLRLSDDMFDQPPGQLEGIAVHTISPLALFQIRAGVAWRNSFGPLSERQVRDDGEAARALLPGPLGGAAPPALRAAPRLAAEHDLAAARVDRGGGNAGVAVGDPDGEVLRVVPEPLAHLVRLLGAHLDPRDSAGSASWRTSAAPGCCSGGTFHCTKNGSAPVFIARSSPASRQLSVEPSPASRDFSSTSRSSRPATTSISSVATTQPTSGWSSVSARRTARPNSDPRPPPRPRPRSARDSSRRAGRFGSRFPSPRAGRPAPTPAPRGRTAWLPRRPGPSTA